MSQDEKSRLSELIAQAQSPEDVLDAFKQIEREKRKGKIILPVVDVTYECQLCTSVTIRKQHVAQPVTIQTTSCFNCKVELMKWPKEELVEVIFNFLTTGNAHAEQIRIRKEVIDWVAVNKMVGVIERIPENVKRAERDAERSEDVGSLEETD